MPGGPLAGYRILEIAQALAVPFAGLLLADLGADVIKVEPPEGDGIRHTMEPILPGESKGYTLVNRGKRAVCLDITREDARPVLQRLVAWADAVLVSLKPADLPRYGLTCDDLRAWNPRIVVLEHVPLGHAGPFGGDPGYDVVVQAISGLSVTTARERGGVPMNIRPAFNDMATGAFSALGVVAALLHRERTGEPLRLETSLLGTAMALGNQLLSWFAATDPPRDEAFRAALAAARAAGADFEAQRRIYEQTYLRGSAANIYFRVYRTSDGFVAVGCLSPALNARFRAVTGLHDPRTEPGWDFDAPGAADRLAALVADAEARFAADTTASWLERLRAGGVPCGPLNFPPEAMFHPQLVDNGFVVELEHPLFGAYRTFGPAVRVEGSAAPAGRHPPLLDEHTDEVLAELGFDGAEVARLRAAGVAGAAPPGA
ncbi:CaiB/BaiF CoA-transferase family protein [Tepidiforma sp.]|uniref:CaiB/BaiF CoA transferase family protein n=1 Tax=Tepidiforma sp. TaxID=2682230 RepID=UPI0026255485|nr:CaiB/BaiF CoA-transferase family protein [Tepidiforma sp.]MCX7616500.1 CoA transferase [Tepidiforma sp.]